MDNPDPPVDNSGDGGRVNVLGVDPSLTATALCCAPSRSERAGFTVSRTRASEPGTVVKLDRMRTQVSAITDAAGGSHLVVVEAPSFASQGSATRDLAGLWWLMFDALCRLDVPLGVVPPSVLKKWATGKGTADKFLVGQAIARRWPAVELRSDDEADALVLASIGLHWLDLLPWRPTTFQTEQLSRVEWIGAPPSALVKEFDHAR